MRPCILALLVILAACNPSSASSADADSPTPTQTPDLEALADAYLQIVDASNSVGCGFTEALRDSPSDLDLVQERARQFADATRVAAEALRELTFPIELQEHVDGLIESRARVESDLRAVAASADSEAVNTAIDRLFEASRQEGSATINAIRAGLGLPDISDDVCGR